MNVNVASRELSKTLQELTDWKDIGRKDGVEQYSLGYLREKLVTSPIPQSEVEKALYEGVDATAGLCIEKIKSGDIHVATN